MHVLRIGMKQGVNLNQKEVKMKAEAKQFCPKFKMEVSDDQAENCSQCGGKLEPIDLSVTPLEKGKPDIEGVEKPRCPTCTGEPGKWPLPDELK